MNNNVANDVYIIKKSTVKTSLKIILLVFITVLLILFIANYNLIFYMTQAKTFIIKIAVSFILMFLFTYISLDIFKFLNLKKGIKLLFPTVLAVICALGSVYNMIKDIPLDFPIPMVYLCILDGLCPILAGLIVMFLILIQKQKINENGKRSM
ncbi:MAG TPA: hypothetical protein PKI60_04495 [Oscillospiraceae bacterium]|nr:hypothetical protein [Oscillospiraceae bacterium]